MLWQKEKKLILLLDKIKYFERIVEGARKIKTLFDEKNGNVHEKDVPTPSIVLPGEFSRPTNGSYRNAWMGGSIDDRLRYLHRSQQVNETTPPSPPLLTSERSLNSKAKSVASYQKELPALQQEATALSSEILIIKQKLCIDKPVCETLSAKDLNIKMGGDGSFYDKDGNAHLIASEPLSKSCIGKKGQVGKNKVWLLECVLCPAYYADSDSRFKQWVDFSSTRKEQKYETDTEEE